VRTGTGAGAERTSPKRLLDSSSTMATSLHSGPVTYSEAIHAALAYQMEANPRVLVYGLGVDDPTAMYGTLSGFPERFGSDRCFDTPLSEDSLTGYGIGLAVAGYYPIHVHQRTDFLLLCCNQLINMAAKIKYLSNGKLGCPFVVRAITGRSWGQGSQHSQSFHSLFANIPGLRVLTPATPQDVYNVYINVFSTQVPTIVIEHRMLYGVKGTLQARTEVPSLSQIDCGNDLTICSVSHMTLEAEKAVIALTEYGITCDHFSLVNNSEINYEPLLKSAKKTGKVLIVDHGWLNASVATTLCSGLAQGGFNGKISLMGYKQSPCPTSRSLENLFYPTADSILGECARLMKINAPLSKLSISQEISSFKGPF